LSPAANARLEQFFRDWQVPNPDRNRRADVEYEWPGAYTENHALNILVGAYLIDVALERDRSLRRELLQRFLFDRARWGWSEFHSPSYLLVTAKALTCLVDFAPDAEIKQAATMHLDLLLIEYAGQCVNDWRGVPFVRGYGSQVNNAASSALSLIRFWFPRGEAPAGSENPFLVHALCSGYRPPALAAELITDQQQRGRYTMRAVGTTGPAKLRVPMMIHVTPVATIASAQGFGSYYDGCYWSVSFASSPQNVLTGSYQGGRNLLQCDNTLAVFGEIGWHGQLKPQRTGNTTIGGDGAAWIGQVDLGDDAHLLLLGEESVHPDAESFGRALAALQPSFTNGVLSWKMPDGRAVRMTNERRGERWGVRRATINDQLVRLDANLLLNAPFIRSVRDSAVFEVLHRGRKQVYDFRDPQNPKITAANESKLRPLPSERLSGPLGLELLYIPPGEFPMGSPLTEGRAEERPQRSVNIDGFYISKTEITVGQYRQYLKENPKTAAPPEWYWKEQARPDQFAMTWVSWPEANAFCQWLSKKTGRAYRLPTEAEWEKAAKGYGHRPYPWGERYDGRQAGTPNEVYAPVATHPIDESPFGVLDMAGGVWEWCADGYDPEAYRRAASIKPAVPPAVGVRSLRSCGWNFDPDTFRCSYRTGLDGDRRSLHIGFRVGCAVAE
ncbi:SUMF1/EgtB/PvdO family nonheme iron enzyme, partial [bacterium]|nr:SUMF1/EgtB/PvdO family nonheme iron enzyme [bacterium]